MLIHVDGEDVESILKSVKDAVDVLGRMWRSEIEKRHVVLVVKGATFTKIQAPTQGCHRGVEGEGSSYNREFYTTAVS